MNCERRLEIRNYQASIAQNTLLSTLLKQSTMASINPYIHFNGNAEEAFSFYKKAFGGEYATLVRFKDMKFEGAPDWGNEADKIMHVSLPIGKHSTLMGSDTPSMMGTHNEKETRSKISINTDTKEEADQLFTALSEGGEVEMPMADSPWGSYFGMFRDKYGIEWMISFETQRA